MRTMLLAAVSLTPLMITAPVTAQSQDETMRVDRIIVTAQKREEEAFGVPITITAYSGEDLELLDVRAFDELSDFTPGLTVQLQSPNNPAFVIRGITSDSGNFQEPPRVSVFLNGVDVSRSRGSAFELFDLERVEIVKGPQSTLFGTAASIGAVSVHTARPQEEFGGSLYAGYGNLDYRIIGGHLTGGNEILQGRIAAQYRERDGFVENIAGQPGSNAFSAQGDLNGIDTIAIRPSLSFTPHDRFRLDLVYNYERNTPPGTAFKSGVIAPSGGDTSPFTFAELGGAGGNPMLRFDGVTQLGQPILTPVTDADIAAVLGGTELGLRRTVHDINASFEIVATEAFTVSGIFGYREFNSLEIFDADGSQVPLMEAAEDTEGQQYSAELRANYDRGGRFRGFVGLSYFQEEGFQRAPFVIDETIFAACLVVPNAQNMLTEITLAPTCLNQDGSFNRFNLFPSPQNPNPIIPAANGPGIFTPAEFTNTGDIETYSAFADLTWDITPQFELTVGGRYVYEDITSGLATNFPDSFLIFAQAAQDPTIPFPVFSPLLDGLANTNNQMVTANDSFDSFLPRFNALYRLNEGLNVYATIAKGRRSPSLSITQTATLDPSDPRFTDPALNPCVNLPPPQQLFCDNPFAPDPFVPNDVVLPIAELTPAEIVWNYEIGFRAELAGGRARLEGALFYQDYENFRVQVVDIGAGGINNISAGKASNIGLELQGEAFLTEDLRAMATFAYIDASIDDDPQNGIFAGNRFRLQPKYSGSFALDYRRPVTNDIEGFLTGVVTYRSGVFFEAENRPIAGLDITEDSVTLANLRGGFSLNEGRYEISGFVKNLFNSDYVIDAGNIGGEFGSPTFIPGPPRTYGVEVRARF